MFFVLPQPKHSPVTWALMAHERVAVLARHLVSAQPTALPEFDPGEVYLFLTRDNVELREQMLGHLKVCSLCCARMLQSGCLQRVGRAEAVVLRRTTYISPTIT